MGMRLFRFIFRRNSKEVAKDRLKLLLVSDRTDCSADMLEMIKNDIIQVISRYMEIDADGLNRIGTPQRKRSGVICEYSDPERKTPA